MDIVFQALADPHRRKIINLLKEKDRCVKDLLEHFSFRQASLSHHLKILKDAQLVTTEKRGQFMYYKLNKATIESAATYIKKMIEQEEPLLFNPPLSKENKENKDEITTQDLPREISPIIESESSLTTPPSI